MSIILMLSRLLPLCLCIIWVKSPCSPCDGAFLFLLQAYSCSIDGTVRLWDFTDGILIKVQLMVGLVSLCNWQHPEENVQEGSVWIVCDLFQTYVIGYPIYAIYASANHEGVVFIVTPMAGDKRSGGSSIFSSTCHHLGYWQAHVTATRFSSESSHN